MPAATAILQRPGTRDDAQELSREAMSRVGDELYRDFERTGETRLWRAAVLARAMENQLARGAEASAVDAPDEELLPEVLTRFRAVVRAQSTPAPQQCTDCQGMGFRHITGDIGEVCMSCGGSGATC